MNGIDQSIGPGLGGFVAFFLLACALWLLMRNMIKRLRNVDHRAAQAPEASGRDAGEVRTRPSSVGRRPSQAAGDDVHAAATNRDPASSSDDGDADPEGRRD